MKAFLIEDEPMALERLVQIMNEVAPSIQIVGEADSVESAIDWLSNNATPDIIFSDIQLGDGTCFEVFSSCSPKCPIIFITAYQEHAIEAFKVNAIDYLLKPLKKEDLERAVAKLSPKANPSAASIDYTQLAQAILREEQKFNRRYLIRYGEQIRTITSDDIAYIYTTLKSVFMVTHAGKEYPFDKSLDALEKELDPKKFFRINRQFIISFKSIGKMHPASKSRVQLELTPEYKGDEVIVSTEKSPLFKEWLGDH